MQLARYDLQVLEDDKQFPTLSRGLKEALLNILLETVLNKLADIESQMSQSTTKSAKKCQQEQAAYEFHKKWFVEEMMGSETLNILTSTLKQLDKRMLHNFRLGFIFKWNKRKFLIF